MPVDWCDYVDEQGTLLFQTRGLEQRSPDGNGGWHPELNGTRRVLYHLPTLLDAIGFEERVVLVPHESDVHTIEIWFDAHPDLKGGVATTVPGGYDCWRPEFTSVFTDAHVAVIIDNDPPAQTAETGSLTATAALTIVTALTPVAAAVKILRPVVGVTVTDHIAAGLPLGQLQALTVPDLERLSRPPVVLDAHGERCEVCGVQSGVSKHRLPRRTGRRVVWVARCVACAPQEDRARGHPWR